MAGDRGAQKMAQGTFTFLNSGKTAGNTLEPAALVMLDRCTSSDIGRAVSHAVLRAFAVHPGIEDAGTELISYRAFSGLLPQSVAMAYVVEMHPEICLAQERIASICAV